MLVVGRDFCLERGTPRKKKRKDHRRWFLCRRLRFWGGERQSLSSGIEEAQISLDLIFWLPLGNECALEFELHAERRALVRVQRRILVQANRETLVREEEETGRKVSSRWIHQPSNDVSKTSKRDAKIYAWSHLQMCTSITRTRRVC